MSNEISVDLSAEDEKKKPLVGGYKPCNPSEEDLLHEGLIYL